MATNCRLLVVGRAAAYRNARPRPRRYQRREDPVVYAQLKAVLRERGSYGYRRATVLVNRDFGVGYNRKRIQRVMRLTGLALAVRRRVRNRRSHRGRVVMPGSNQRWCSDKMTIACWNGDSALTGLFPQARATSLPPCRLGGSPARPPCQHLVERCSCLGLPPFGSERGHFSARSKELCRTLPRRGAMLLPRGEQGRVARIHEV